VLDARYGGNHRIYDIDEENLKLEILTAVHHLRFETGARLKEDVIAVSLDAIFGEAARMKSLGYRLVTLTCVDIDENHFEILYHFDKNLKMRHYRVQAPKGRVVPSISSTYFSAFLVENEIQDHFGIRFEGLVLDYNGTLYLDDEVRTTPFCKYTVSAAPGVKTPKADETVADKKGE
jgi:ech hydrogenase subunit D